MWVSMGYLLLIGYNDINLILFAYLLLSGITEKPSPQIQIEPGISSKADSN
jgi:hypothetical protein